MGRAEHRADGELVAGSVVELAPRNACEVAEVRATPKCAMYGLGNSSRSVSVGGSTHSAVNRSGKLTTGIAQARSSSNHFVPSVSSSRNGIEEQCPRHHPLRTGRSR